MTLLCAGATDICRLGGFAPADHPLHDGERRKAAALRLPGPPPDRIVAAPSAAAAGTADAMGLPATTEPRLADAGQGAWAGRTFADLHAADAGAFAAWLASPEDGVPNGEPLTAVSARVSSWLAEVAAGEGRLLAVTHAMVMRAILSAAIGLPLAAAMRIDLAPLGHATLSFHRGWRLQALSPRGAAG